MVNVVAAIAFNAFGTLQRGAPPVRLSPDYPEPPAPAPGAAADAVPPAATNGAVADPNTSRQNGKRNRGLRFTEC
ncbi:hypothetical protein L1887_28178 [Cichorium endivia]|nr:hypothetical protein L1887_28178 [Cichorium endivia]